MQAVERDVERSDAGGGDAHFRDRAQRQAPCSRIAARGQGQAHDHGVGGGEDVGARLGAVCNLKLLHGAEQERKGLPGPAGRGARAFSSDERGPARAPSARGDPPSMLDGQIRGGEADSTELRRRELRARRRNRSDDTLEKAQRLRRGPTGRPAGSTDSEIAHKCSPDPAMSTEAINRRHRAAPAATFAITMMGYPCFLSARSSSPMRACRFTVA